MWRVTHDMRHMMGGEHSLKILAPQLLRFGIDSVMKVLNERIKYKGVYRTAPTTPALVPVLPFISLKQLKFAS